MTRFPLTRGPLKTECELTGEHRGDAVVYIGPEPEAVERWTCCGDTRVVGEVFDCDTCNRAGIRPHGAELPPGWAENYDGTHCERCQA